jgi:DnaJ-class molecular chaperone
LGPTWSTVCSPISASAREEVMKMAREICPMCDGIGSLVDEDNQTTVTCDACGGEGFIETDD